MNTAAQSLSSRLHSLASRPAARTWQLDEAYRYCESVVRSHYENFPVGSFLVPRALRRHFYSVYAFARIADDFADEHEGRLLPDERLELLHKWHGLLKEAAEVPVNHPVFAALGDTIREFDLPIQLFEDLLSAFSQDVSTGRYATFEQLMDYCRRSANPVGRLVLMLFGYRDARRFEWSDAICSALQLANHWQDVGIDLRKQRVYLPVEDLARFDLDADNFAETERRGNFRELMRFETHRTREMFQTGKPLCAGVSGRLALELRAVWLGGWRILDLIEKADFDVLAARPRITTTGRLAVLLRALSPRAFDRIDG